MQEMKRVMAAVLLCLMMMCSAACGIPANTTPEENSTEPEITEEIQPEETEKPEAETLPNKITPESKHPSAMHAQGANDSWSKQESEPTRCRKTRKLLNKTDGPCATANRAIREEQQKKVETPPEMVVTTPEPVVIPPESVEVAPEPTEVPPEEVDVQQEPVETPPETEPPVDTETKPAAHYTDTTYIGFLEIPCCGISVDLYETNSVVDKQTIVDRENSACWMDWNTSPIIADHVNQGFSAIKDVSIGQQCSITRDGVATVYECVEIDPNGLNDGYSLRMSDDRRLHSLGSDCIAMYTCNGNWSSITVVVFRTVQ